MTREYAAAIAKHDAAIGVFKISQIAYRRGMITDEAFLAAKAEYDAATREFDIAYAKEASMSQAHILRAVNSKGEIRFYTGRAGAGWLDQDRGSAFDYASREAAQRKAMQFNRMTSIHDFHFLAVAKEER